MANLIRVPSILSGTVLCFGIEPPVQPVLSLKGPVVCKEEEASAEEKTTFLFNDRRFITLAICNELANEFLQSLAFLPPKAVNNLVVVTFYDVECILDYRDRRI